jgi:dihydrofolate synthase/folylpolyglutamate synthase
MKNISKQSPKGAVPVGKQRSYNELIEFLDKNWSKKEDNHVSCLKKLDLALGSIAKKLNTVFVSGSNGKSLTMNFTAQLLDDEGLKVGMFYAPHVLTYNERFCINNDFIANKAFADLANEVINSAEAENLKADSLDILTMTALLYFYKNNVDVALCEVNEGDPLYTTGICSPKISAITRIAMNTEPDSEENKLVLESILHTVQKDTHVISADQSKLNLQTMLEIAESKGGTWAMPIRKLATLSYPFEQLHGRCAALAERIGEIFINNFASLEKIKTDSLLAKQKGQRGRPTLEAKRQAELNPKKTIEQFWNETENSLPCRFQLLDKEKPSVLLDNANNLDAFKNLLLGIRLLHYKRPLKGLSLIIGCNNADLELDEFLKLLRYFFKKTSGNIIVCPVKPAPGDMNTSSWNVEKVTNDIKSMKIKARSAKNFKEAFDLAQSSVDERNGLVVVAGSSSLLAEYWQNKGTKKL